MVKSTASRNSQGKKQIRRKSLTEEILATGILKNKSAKRKSLHEEEGEDNFVDTKASRKILKIGQDLAEEDLNERQLPPQSSNAFNFESRFEEEDDQNGKTFDDDEEAWGDEDEEETEDAEVDPADLDLFNKFVSPDEAELMQHNMSSKGSEEQSQNLADIIMQKIAEHEAKEENGLGIQGSGAPEDAIEIPAKVVEVYQKIGQLLSRYKSGKLPKPFKIIPTIPYWEDLLAMTNPSSWTPNACYEATKIFTAGNTQQSQIFLETVILERVRQDIHETKKLNVHLFNALKKALFKPAPFFKGFLFPLVSSGTATLREAHIIASVLNRVSIPVLHSAAALLRLCEIAAEQASSSTESGGATNIFIRTLLEKKYALPYKVIDALVFHFLRFKSTNPLAADVNGAENAMLGVVDQESKEAREAKLPVLWHQSLLSFSQRYRNDITEDQREALLDLLLTKGHSKIGPEVRRELLEGRGRGIPMVENGVGDGGDDTMMVDPVS